MAKEPGCRDLCKETTMEHTFLNPVLPGNVRCSTLPCCIPLFTSGLKFSKTSTPNHLLNIPDEHKTLTTVLLQCYYSTTTTTTTTTPTPTPPPAAAATTTTTTTKTNNNTLSLNSTNKSNIAKLLIRILHTNLGNDNDKCNNNHKSIQNPH